ncbi:MFS transporter [Gymnodinialimonas sp. 2305UL16-5]|uniref:MFS transporter n=1 Tax=Gymnodinialimonas mytili TaxID=3126503 RepID=UPI0030B055A3
MVRAVQIAGGAFSDRQFRLFFIGIFCAVQAIWIQRVTLGWLAWERTGQASVVGLVAGLSLVPSLLTGPFFGVLVDRVNIKHAALVTNGSMAAWLAVLALSAGQVGAVGLAIAALGIGVISAAHHPVRMSLAPRLVAPEMVQHVVSVTALNFNLARLVAPVIAGWIIATAGGGVALWIAAACYLPMLSILPVLTPRALPPRPARPFFSDLLEGLRFAAARPLIRNALLITLALSVIVRGALELLPVLADGGYGRGAAGLGLLTAAAGGGALVAAVFKTLGVGHAGASISVSVWALAIVGQSAVVLMGVGPTWPMAMSSAALAGAASTWVGISLQAAIQTDLPDGYRGRVMSLWIVVGLGSVSLGAFAIGGLAQILGIGAALVCAGLAGLTMLALVAFRMRSTAKAPN